MQVHRRERVFHFSEDPSIQRFVPRPVEVPADRAPGMDWLDGPLVWAITEQRQAAYLFPRHCPRLVLWLTASTTESDRNAWWGSRSAAMIACVEWAWLDAIRSTELFRYELPVETFSPLENDDGWMCVSDEDVVPLEMQPCGDLLAAHARLSTELRVMESLRPLADVWSTSLHASGIRLRNARGWS